MDQKQIERIFSDEAFVASLLNMDTAEEVQAALKRKGITFSIEEIYQIRNGLMACANGELSEAELDEVAGGILISTIIGIIFGVITGVSTGVSAVHGWTNGRW